ncbi:Alpha/beta hydrolase fold-3, partial [Sistotremastrum suecicum HHB10207 ss-3]
LAPENPFPTQLEDCLSAIRWGVQNARKLNSDVRKGFIIGGYAAGANLAASIAHITRDDSTFKTKFTGQFLQLPMLCHVDAHPNELGSEFNSMFEPDQYNTPLHGRQAFQKMWEMYGAPDPEDPKVSPLCTKSFNNLPASYIQIAGQDPLRDEGLLYSEALTDNSVSVKVDVYPGCPHGFAASHPETTASKKYKADAVVGLKWLVRGDPTWRVV